MTCGRFGGDVLVVAGDLAFVVGEDAEDAEALVERTEGGFVERPGAEDFDWTVGVLAVSAAQR